MATNSTKFIQFNSYKDGETLHHFELDKKKLLVGNFEHCDIHIDDPHISKYHAFIILDLDGGGQITDLSSKNGVYLNGKKVDKAYFTVGDRIELGTLELYVEELIPDEGTTMLDLDQQNVIEMRIEALEQKAPEPPPLEGLTVIDGEYCDIVFRDDQYNTNNDTPLESELDFNAFIDPEEEKEVLPITRDKNELCLQVLTVSNGNILSYDYLTLDNKTYFLSAKNQDKNTIMFYSYNEEEDLPFITVDNGNVKIQHLEGHDCINKSNKQNPFSSAGSAALNQEDCYIFTKGTNQLIVRYAQAPPYLKSNSFFERDPEFRKQASKVFSGLMAIMLLLLLVKITQVKEPVEQISVVYRKAVKKTAFSSNSKKQNDMPKKEKGTRKNKQKKKKVASAKVAKQKSRPKATTPEPAKKKVAKAKIKQYQFKMANNLTSLFGKSSSTEKTQLKKATRAVASVKGLSGAKAASTASLKASSSVDVGSLGADLGGKFDTSSGAKGFGEKKGIDTTYIDPRTVVLGSMDPELLRKILQEYLPQFRHCYQQELQYQNDRAKGVIDLNFRINKNGKVSKVDIKTKGGKFSQKGTGCMAGVLRLIKFPKPKGGGLVDVRQPLNFFSEKSNL